MSGPQEERRLNRCPSSSTDVDRKKFDREAVDVTFPPEAPLSRKKKSFSMGSSSSTCIPFILLR